MFINKSVDLACTFLLCNFNQGKNHNILPLQKHPSSREQLVSTNNQLISYYCCFSPFRRLQLICLLINYLRTSHWSKLAHLFSSHFLAGLSWELCIIKQLIMKLLFFATTKPTGVSDSLHTEILDCKSLRPLPSQEMVLGSSPATYTQRWMHHWAHPRLGQTPFGTQAVQEGQLHCIFSGCRKNSIEIPTRVATLLHRGPSMNLWNCPFQSTSPRGTYNIKVPKSKKVQNAQFLPDGKRWLIAKYSFMWLLDQCCLHRGTPWL